MINDNYKRNLMDEYQRKAMLKEVKNIKKLNSLERKSK